MYTVGRKLAYGQSDAAVEIVKGRPYITLAPQRGDRGLPILLRCWMATYFLRECIKMLRIADMGRARDNTIHVMAYVLWLLSLFLCAEIFSYSVDVVPIATNKQTCSPIFDPKYLLPRAEYITTCKAV